MLGAQSRILFNNLLISHRQLMNAFMLERGWARVEVVPDPEFELLLILKSFPG